MRGSVEQDASFAERVLRAESVGAKPRNIRLLPATAARRLVGQTDAADCFADGVMAAEVYPLGFFGRVLAGLALMAVAVAVPVVLFYVLFDGDARFFFRALPLLYHKLPLWFFLLLFVGLPIVSLGFLRQGLVILSTRAVLAWGAEGALLLSYRLFRRKEIFLPLAELAGIDWVSAGSGFEVRLLTDDGKSHLAARLGYAPGTAAWLARALHETLAVPVVGNVPLPPPGDKALQRKVKWLDEGALYPEEAEVYTTGLFPGGSVPERFAVRRLEEGEFVLREDGRVVVATEPGMVVFEDLRSGKSALGAFFLLLFFAGTWLLAWHDTDRNHKGEVVLYLMPLMVVIVGCVLVDFLTGKIWLYLTPDRLVRKRQWLGLSMCEAWHREAAAGVELFRDMRSADDWVLKMRWRKGEKIEKSEPARTNDPVALRWLAGTLGAWSGAPVIKRPKQYIDPREVDAAE